MVRGLRGPGCIMFAAATWERDFQFLVCRFPSLHDCPDARTFTVMGRKGAKPPASSTPPARCWSAESMRLETALCRGTESVITWPWWYIKGSCISKQWQQCYKHIIQQNCNRKKTPQISNFFSSLLMPNGPHKYNNLMSWPLSCVKTSGPWLTSEMSRLERNSMFFCYFKRNASLQSRPIIHVRSLSFHTDSTINHQTRTYIIGNITCLKGLAEKQTHFLNWTWTPEQPNLSWLWKQIKKFTGVERSSWILDIWLLSEPQTVHTKQRERIRLNCPGKKNTWN